jgi:hypothetical protein
VKDGLFDIYGQPTKPLESGVLANLYKLVQALYALYRFLYFVSLIYYNSGELFETLRVLKLGRVIK